MFLMTSLPPCLPACLHFLLAVDLLSLGNSETKKLEALCGLGEKGLGFALRVWGFFVTGICRVERKGLRLRSYTYNQLCVLSSAGLPKVVETDPTTSQWDCPEGD